MIFVKIIYIDSKHEHDITPCDTLLLSSGHVIPNIFSKINLCSFIHYKYNYHLKKLLMV